MCASRRLLSVDTTITLKKDCLVMFALRRGQFAMIVTVIIETNTVTSKTI
jgi:hypothetical protein